MKKTLKMCAIALLALVAFSACKKQKTVDPNVQLGIDTLLIKDFVAKNALTGVKQLGTTGLYYKIIEPGTGTGVYKESSIIKANYTGRLLSGSIFDKSITEPYTFYLGGNVIYGWTLGVQLIRKGGKIRLFIPSAYAYGTEAQGSIPANAVLDFDIELVDVQY
ncbi:MAG: peptidylprolyl isomerase [Sphingobacteriales bacterium]|nr:peptidylprolyl isomerase [Sphingobacteriales bacterium]